MFSKRYELSPRLLTVALLSLFLVLLGCPGDDDDSAVVDDDDVVNDDDVVDDDDSGPDDDDVGPDDDDSGPDDDDVGPDDDDIGPDDDDIGPDDDDIGPDDDDSADEIATVTLTAAVVEADTRSTITVVVDALDGSSAPIPFDVSDVSFGYTTVDGAPTPATSGYDISSITAGVTTVVATIAGVDSAGLDLTFVGSPVALGDLVINELLVDGTAGDANGDGSTNADEDTFVEFVSVATVELSLEGAQVYETRLAFLARHTFDAGVLLAPGESVVVFGGGSPATAPLGATFFAADNAGDSGNPFFLHLNPTGGTLELRNAASDVLVDLAWGTDAGGTPDANIDESITLDPQITGTTWDAHTTVGGDPAVLFSPGTLADGTLF